MIPLTEDPMAAKAEEVFDETGHILCCNLADDFVGFTVTLCGREVLEYEVETLEDNEESDCAPCNYLDKTDFCPLEGACSYR